jgi:sulfatase modifying factor 1
MKANITTTAIFAALSVLASAAVNIDWVTVGDPGNAANTSEFGSYKPGSVGYEYQIGKYEVSIGQYAEFLNNAAKNDAYGLWHPAMQSQGTIAGISRSGSEGSYVYSTFGSVNRPIAYVSWFDAARFANWIQNGQGSGSTESGAYALNGATSGIILAQTNATIRLPTLDEWYKAAYYDPTPGAGGGDQYWRYATRSESLVSNSIDGNYFDGDYATTQSNVYDESQNYLTDVGAYSGKSSYYGTFDQLGNVMEWNDRFGMDENTDPLVGRGVSGGAWSSGGPFPSALWFSNNNFLGIPQDEGHQSGFRLVSISIPEPSTTLLTLLFSTGLLCRRRKNL